MLAAAAVGAPRGDRQAGRGRLSSLQALEGAISERTSDPVPIHLVAAPEGYVAGEESAVVQLPERRRAAADLRAAAPVRARATAGGRRWSRTRRRWRRSRWWRGSARSWYRELGTSRRSRLGAGHDRRRGGRARGLRAGLRHLDARPAGGRRRRDRAASGAAGRRLLRHLGRGGARHAPSTGPGGSALGGLHPRVRGADRARAERLRVARERAGDRLPGRRVGRPVRPVRVRAAGDRRLGRRRWPTGSPHAARAGPSAPLGHRDPGPRRLPPSRRRGALRRERAQGVRLARSTITGAAGAATGGRAGLPLARRAQRRR